MACCNSNNNVTCCGNTALCGRCGFCCGGNWIPCACSNAVALNRRRCGGGCTSCSGFNFPEGASCPLA